MPLRLSGTQGAVQSSAASLWDYNVHMYIDDTDIDDISASYELYHQFNLSLSSAIYMLQFELFIACHMLLSSGSSFSTKRNAEALDRWCNTTLTPIFISTEADHQGSERVEIAEMQNTTAKTTSEIRRLLRVKLASRVPRQRNFEVWTRNKNKEQEVWWLL